MAFRRNSVGEQFKVFPIARLGYDNQTALLFVSVSQYSAKQSVKPTDNLLKSVFVWVSVNSAFSIATAMMRAWDSEMTL